MLVMTLAFSRFLTATMPVAFFTRTRTGALVSRLNNDVPTRPAPAACQRLSPRTPRMCQQ